MATSCARAIDKLSAIIILPPHFRVYHLVPGQTTEHVRPPETFDGRAHNAEARARRVFHVHDVASGSRDALTVPPTYVLFSSTLSCPDSDGTSSEHGRKSVGRQPG